MPTQNATHSARARRAPSVVLWLSLIIGLVTSRSSAQASSGTVPFVLEDNRIYAKLAFVRPDGSLRETWAFVDLGTPVLVVHEKLRHELQSDPAKPFTLRVGELQLQVDSSQTQTSNGSFRTGTNGKATIPVEAVLPGSVMSHYQVVFDYARRTLTLALPGTPKPQGNAIPCRVNEKTGLISVSAVIAGNTYALAIDSGSAYSWVRAEVAQQWIGSHTAWKRGTGAVGESNMQTRDDGAEARASILRVPEIMIGSLRIEQVGMLGIVPQAPPFPPVPGEGNVQGDFFDWYSRKAPEPVIGWLGGNVLKGFQLTIDFPRQMTYWERETDLDPHDLDQVGVTLETHDREPGYFIAGVAEKDGKPTVQGARAGDKLLRIDEMPVEGATRGAIFSALHGKPGQVRTLVVERDGQRLTIPAVVTAF